MDVIQLVTLSFTAVAATAAIIGVAFAWFSHRARLRSELPKIQIRGWTYENSDQPFPWLMSFTFEIGRDHNSVGWEIIRVEANKSRGSRCLLASANGDPEWQEFYDFSRPVSIGHLRIENAQGEGWLTFVCQRPLRKTGKHKRTKVPVPYVVGVGLTSGGSL